MGKNIISKKKKKNGFWGFWPLLRPKLPYGSENKRSGRGKLYFLYTFDEFSNNIFVNKKVRL